MTQHRNIWDECSAAVDELLASHHRREQSGRAVEYLAQVSQIPDPNARRAYLADFIARQSATITLPGDRPAINFLED